MVRNTASANPFWAIYSISIKTCHSGGIFFESSSVLENKKIPPRRDDMKKIALFHYLETLF
jgi:hypothetical protein